LPKEGNKPMDRQVGRNNTIELWRFMFVCAICIMHFSNSYFGASLYFSSAYVATEFFFIVSGYLFDHQIVNWFGKISLPMFLNQIFVINLMGSWFVGLGYSIGVGLFLILLVIASLIEMTIVWGLRRIFTKR
jgi:peptidoglycan/LPS O-acetylase OafA/YrhL